MLTRLQADLKAAMLAKQVQVVSTLRLTITAISVEQTAKGVTNKITELDEQNVIKRLVKQRQDSIEQYTKAGALDRAQAEQDEIYILKLYLPKELTDQELANAVTRAIAQTSATSRKDMGAVMGALKAEFGNAYDAKKASQLVTSRLA